MNNWVKNSWRVASCVTWVESWEILICSRSLCALSTQSYLICQNKYLLAALNKENSKNITLIQYNVYEYACEDTQKLSN